MQKTVTITYSGAPQDVDREQRIALDAGKFYTALFEMSQWIRSKQKYGDADAILMSSVAEAFKERLGDIDLYGYE